METSIAEARSYFDKALQLGKKEGGAPKVLDSILLEAGLKAPCEIPLGVQDITLEQITGTKTEGRKYCFSKNFYPLMKADTEFGAKWINLCSSHLEEGIHTPIKVYEYLNEYYVLEGNKRVSVSKYFDTYSISADVIRILPPIVNTPETMLYYEYLDFYALTKINYIYFTKPLGFTKLKRCVGKKRNEVWSADDCMDFNSVFTRFRLEYTKLMGPQGYRTVSDAFLAFVTVFGYSDMIDMNAMDFKKNVKKYADEFELMLEPETSRMQLDPYDKKPNIIKAMVPKVLTKKKIAFIYEKNPHTSGWTFNHENGRRDVERILGDEVEFSTYYDVTTETIRETLEDIIGQKHQVVFATSPIFLKEMLRAAVEHPEVKFLDCTPHISYKHVRTYYVRLHEVKFLLGAIAGAITTNDKIGYIADYPILGTVANINAFALGAKMVNPRATIYLKWSKQEYEDDGKPLTLEDIYEEYREQDISVISDNDSRNEDKFHNRVGLYHVDGKNLWNIAIPVWNWGVFYEKTISNIINGNWKAEAHEDKSKGIRYWWGLSSNVIDIYHSSRLPIGTVRLIQLLKKQMEMGDFNPFTGPLFAQDHTVQSDLDATLSPDEIIDMDWLADNIIGEIPSKTKLNAQAKEVTKYAGVEKDAQII